MIISEIVRPLATIAAKMLPQAGSKLTSFPIQLVRRPNGAIGTQGVTIDQVADVLYHVAGIKQATASMTMRELVQLLVSNPAAQQRLRASLQSNPIRIQKLPDGTYHILDGHHRLFLLNQLGDTTVPALIL